MPSLEQLKAQHGEPLQTGTDSWIFEDGTRVSGDQYQSITAPQDPLRGQRAYVAAKLKHEEKEWRHYKMQADEQLQNHRRAPSFCPPPNELQIAALKRGKARIEKLRQDLAELDEQLRDPEQEAAKRSQEAANQARRNEVSQLATELRSLSI